VEEVKIEDNSFATGDEAEQVVKNEDVGLVKVAEPEVVEKAPEEEVFFIVEEMPGFKGEGIEGFRNYVQGKLTYPEIAQENGIQGKVYVSFVVEANGKISNVKVVRGVDPALDKAAVAAVEGAPNWTPGKQRGKPVRVSFTIPITFKLQ
jgi:protein TonB